MQEYEQYQTLTLLKTMFPGYDKMLEHIFRQDPVFREIAMEIHECTEKQEMIYQETGKRPGSYTDTINELKEELLAYLNNKELNNLNTCDK